LIAPESERWDLEMLMRQQHVDAFLAFASHEAIWQVLGIELQPWEHSYILCSQFKQGDGFLFNPRRPARLGAIF